MNLRDEKGQLIASVVANGVKPEDFLSHAASIGVIVPRPMLKRWRDRFFTTKALPFPAQPKLLNRFRVGADPEFVFLDPGIVKDYGVEGRAYVHARNFGMHVAEPFGSDMSGRQAEVRAHPSRFVVEVVASLVDTLRWMTNVYQVQPYYWYAGALLGNDGIGGHVHIGRRRPARDRSVQSLDILATMLIWSELGLDCKGAQARQKATAYGKFGDIRPQSHGFEYRTLPSWLDSPLTAYLTLTWAKLAVLHDLVPIQFTAKNKNGYAMLRNLLLAYASRDDDARIALKALDTYGVPKFTGLDFKKNWGIPDKPGVFNINRHFFPSTIQPTNGTVLDVFNYLMKAIPLPKINIEPNWEPFLLPEHVHKVDVSDRHPGVGDVGQGFVSHHQHVRVLGGGPRNSLTISIPKGISVPKEEISAFMAKMPTLRAVKFRSDLSEDEIILKLPSDIQVEYHADGKIVQDIRALLKSGLLPITKGGDMAKYDPAKFVSVKKNTPSLGKVAGEVVGQSER
jgi:hypothetical protein